MSRTSTDQRAFRLAVSIINYRTADLTWTCVQSVLADLQGRDDAVVIIIDNASGDGSADKLADRIAALPAGAGEVRLIRSPVNGGFSAGHNQGLAAVRADYYLVLNSDAVLRPGFSAAILSAADAAPDHFGLFAPCIVYDDGVQQTSLFRFASPASELIRAAGNRPVTWALSRWDVPLRMPPSPEDIGWASFACILLKGEMIDQIGPMDEEYFLYFEDAEYSLRARRAGWHILYVPDAQAIHFRGGSGPVKTMQAERKRLPRYLYVSRNRFMRQAHGPLGPVAANLAFHAGRVLARLKWCYGKRAVAVSERESRDIWINARHPLSRDSASWPEGRD